MTLDELRALLPDLGFAVYAYDPRGPVTLEVHAAEGVFTFTAASEQAAIAAAFPQAEEIPDDDIFA
jgi:hypothetical protein